jgi:hypothetical protein
MIKLLMAIILVIHLCIHTTHVGLDGNSHSSHCVTLTNMHGDICKNMSLFKGPYRETEDYNMATGRNNKKKKSLNCMLYILTLYNIMILLVPVIFTPENKRPCQSAGC